MKWKSKVAVILGAFFVCALATSQTAYAAPPPDDCSLLSPSILQKALGQPFGAPSETKAPPTDACSLLTPAQVNAVLGFSAKSGHPGLNDTSTCVWPLASFAKIGSKDTKLIQVTILDSQDRAKIALLVRALGTVKGVGDAAVYVPANSSLYVKKGNSEFLVFMQGFPLDQIKAKEKTLALEVLAKL